MATNITRLTPSARPSAPGGGGRPGGGRPGGEDTDGGNNLSFPAIWADGSGLALRGTYGLPSLTLPYDGDNDGTPDLIDGSYWYAQNTQNTWQAKNVVATESVYVDAIDWGDNLESVDWYIRRPVRVEVVLYKDLAEPMDAFTMRSLEGSNRYEIKGTNGVVYSSSSATVYSPQALLTIQSVVEDNTIPDDLVFDPAQGWIDTNDGDNDVLGDVVYQGPITAEVNVSGMAIYGYNWRPNAIGTFRLAFSLPLSSQVQFDNAAIVGPSEEELQLATIAAADDGGSSSGGGTAYVMGDENVTYIDVDILNPSGSGGGGGGGRGGGGGGRPRSVSDIFSLGATDVLRSFGSNPLQAQCQSPFEMRELPDFHAGLAVRQSESL